MSTALVERLGGFLAARTNRRSFLARSTLAATALAVNPIDYALRPTTAYAAICQCADANCNCSDLCCDGYTQFCCTINDGVNACPPGTFAGGWWKADGSEYCAGPRYYIDCQGTCNGCGCGGVGFCTSCDNLTCECALGTCANRHVGCTEFRYGQCHQEIGCSGRIACRVVSCTPPWILDPTCTTSAATDDSTANHFAPCQDGPTTNTPALASVVAVVGSRTGAGYAVADDAGGIHAFGDDFVVNEASPLSPNKPVVGMAATPTGNGYWLVAADGGIFTFGDAAFFGSTGNLILARPVVGMAATPTGNGYWLVAADGGIFTFGNAAFFGSTGNLILARPVVGMAATPTGNGYWLVAADGGIFTFGDAAFFGSTGNLILARPVVGMAATPTGNGYWLVAADGGIFTFGDAAFFGSTGNLILARPVVGMAATPTGKGYWLVAADGGIFTFGDAVFAGSDVT